MVVDAGHRCIVNHGHEHMVSDHGAGNSYRPLRTDTGHRVDRIRDKVQERLCQRIRRSQHARRLRGQSEVELDAIRVKLCLRHFRGLANRFVEVDDLRCIHNKYASDGMRRDFNRSVHVSRACLRKRPSGCLFPHLQLGLAGEDALFKAHHR